MKDFAIGTLKEHAPTGKGLTLKSQQNKHDPKQLQQNFLSQHLRPEVPTALDELRNEVVVCRKCRLGGLRINAVFGAGDYNADLMFVGEAPGANEDETGLPFVGRAGQTLSNALAIHGITREEVFISNIVKCRPPANRDPLPDEIAACSPYLIKQIEVIRPALLCALGRYAAVSLLQRPVKIMQEHGQWLEYQGVPLLICIHPSAAMRSRLFKQQFDSDIQTLANRYHALKGSRHGP